MLTTTQSVTQPDPRAVCWSPPTPSRARLARPLPGQVVKGLAAGHTARHESPHARDWERLGRTRAGSERHAADETVVERRKQRRRQGQRPGESRIQNTNTQARSRCVCLVRTIHSYVQGTYDTGVPCTRLAPGHGCRDGGGAGVAREKQFVRVGARRERERETQLYATLP